MKTKNLFIIGFAIVASVMQFSCESSDKKVEEARLKSQDAKVALDKAVQDSINDFQKFKAESELKILNYEKDIAILKIKISKEKKNDQTNYEKMLYSLELRNKELKRDISEYRNEQRSQWNEYRTKFNKNLDELGSSIANFFKDNK